MHRPIIIELLGVMCQDSPKDGSHLFRQINSKHHGQAFRHLAKGRQRFCGVCPCCRDLPATPSQARLVPLGSHSVSAPWGGALSTTKDANAYVQSSRPHTLNLCPISGYTRPIGFATPPKRLGCGPTTKKTMLIKVTSRANTNPSLIGPLKSRGSPKVSLKVSPGAFLRSVQRSKFVCG